MRKYTIRLRKDENGKRRLKKVERTWKFNKIGRAILSLLCFCVVLFIIMLMVKFNSTHKFQMSPCRVTLGMLVKIETSGEDLEKEEFSEESETTEEISSIEESSSVEESSLIEETSSKEESSSNDKDTTTQKPKKEESSTKETSSTEEKPITTAVYTVEHYLLVDNTYMLAEVEHLSGTVGTTVTAHAKAYAGYQENTAIDTRIAKGVITSDGKLVLRLFYDIKKTEESTNKNQNNNNSQSTDTTESSESVESSETPESSKTPESSETPESPVTPPGEQKPQGPGSSTEAPSVPESSETPESPVTPPSEQKPQGPGSSTEAPSKTV